MGEKRRKETVGLAFFHGLFLDGLRVQKGFCRDGATGKEYN